MTSREELLVPHTRKQLARLNIGCGAQIATGWVNADAEPSEDGVVRADVTKTLPWSEGVFDCVVAHHVLQMLTYTQLVPALSELRRVLKSDGVLRMSVPSLLRAVRAHSRGDAEWFPKWGGDETTVDGLFCTYVSDLSNSRSVFTPSWLVELCMRAGFDLAMPAQYGFSPLGGTLEGICELDSREHESNFVEARR